MKKHTPLPWIKRQLHNDGSFFIEAPREQINKPYGQEILADDYFDDLSKEADCDFIIEACNNYKKLKEDNEKLKTALKEIIGVMTQTRNIALDDGTKWGIHNMLFTNKYEDLLKSIE